MNEQTNTSGSQLLSFMKPIYPIVVPAAITAMTLSLVTFDGRRDEHGNEVYLPVSNTPDQPHQHNDAAHAVRFRPVRGGATQAGWTISHCGVGVAYQAGIDRVMSVSSSPKCSGSNI
jgi:hypothetical protein